MENVGGTEVISRAREVLFVAGLAVARTVALQPVLLPAAAAAGRPPTLACDKRRAGPCAAHRPAFHCRLVHMADQIDAAADHQHGGHGPENQNWHL